MTTCPLYKKLPFGYRVNINEIIQSVKALKRRLPIFPQGQMFFYFLTHSRKYLYTCLNTTLKIILLNINKSNAATSSEI